LKARIVLATFLVGFSGWCQTFRAKKKKKKKGVKRHLRCHNVRRVRHHAPYGVQAFVTFAFLKFSAGEEREERVVFS